MSMNPSQNVSSSESTVPLTVSEVVDTLNRNNSSKDGQDIELGTAQDLNDNSKIRTDNGEDEVDRASIYSLFMDKDFRYYFQHPYLRLFIAYLVTFCNFLIYAEDPVAHSEKECFIPVVGRCFSFVVTKYPPNGWAVLKVIMWLTGMIVGMIVGKLFVHQFLFNKLFKLKMFHNDHGSWMVMFFTTIIMLFIFSWIYNGILSLGGVPQYHVSSLMGIKNSWFMKGAACGTWCGDFFTAWMVTDIMLQEKLYPHWGVRPRRWWNEGYHRIYLFWSMTIGMSAIVITVISTDWISWDTLNRDFIPSNELMRAFLASFILVLDLLIVMQDWDFPHFISAFDIKLPGLTSSHLKFHFNLPNWIKKDDYIIHITGKWFNYGIILFVMILDLNMWKNQMFYQPYEYGQYVTPQDKVCTVRDEYSLETYNETYLTYNYRFNNTNWATNETYYAGDILMNSKWLNFSLPVKSMAFIPTLLAFVCFGVLVSYFGRWKPTKKDPHAGRLRKRRKGGRFTRIWRSFSKRRQSAARRRQSSARTATTEDGGLSNEPAEENAMEDIAVGEGNIVSGEKEEAEEREKGARGDPAAEVKKKVLPLVPVASAEDTSI